MVGSFSFSVRLPFSYGFFRPLHSSSGVFFRSLFVFLQVVRFSFSVFFDDLRSLLGFLFPLRSVFRLLFFLFPLFRRSSFSSWSPLRLLFPLSVVRS